ncbi:NACHT domain-containing protein [Lutibacter maritimus]|uniref:NACHT domain-containing protein n=1 Tax=Lutibacter maritimus TaxID=593133 RepID=A0A1I6P0Z8_9FLAO|nr:NACHT domain-containing protein [Lutibacter maritimus]SFS33862.1 NACHT domain-containing protein [Lutibacter maritimus]
MNIKANQLETLSILRLKEVVFSLLEKEGYKNLKSSTVNIITGETKEGLSVLTTTFYLYQKILSGSNVEAKELIEKLKLAHKATNPNSMMLISGFSISKSVESTINGAINFNLEIMQRESLSDLIESHFPNFWMYENFDLVSYEKYFLEEMVEKSALLNIQGLEAKAKKLIEIYVKPRIFEIKSDLESNSTQLNRVQEIDIMKRTKSCVIEGDTGSGKSTLLKEIGRLQIEEQQELKTLPIFISPILLFNSDFNIQAASTKLLKDKVPGDWNEIIQSYNILLLIDNIDDFEEKEQINVVEQLNDLSKSKNIRYILTTRSIKTGKINSYCKDVSFFQLRKFNDTQIKEFTSRFFNDNGISSNLIDALEDHRILERLPLTPLSLSLIALVYEKENYEIPATISDIYDNFNQLILGKITATKKFDIIDFNFRERILSIYALEILQNNNGRPFSKINFVKFFKEYFEAKSSSVATEVIEEFLHFFIDNSGILKIEEEEYVNFSHKSFLEYYASLEIFKHKRNLEKDLVDNFLDLNWQNVAIFFAGQSKDMPDFLRNIIEKIKEASKLEEHNNAILGLGYLLQALYQTDNKLREEAVLLSLNQSLILHEWYKKIISDGDILLFKKMRLPALSIFNMYYFYLNFLSSTLSEPLSLAFNRLLEKYKEEGETSTGYQLLTIAAIFHSKRISNSQYLQKLLDETSILKDPYLVTVAEFALYFNSSSDHKDIKQQLGKAYLKMKNVTKDLIKLPANRLRFSNLDLIESNKKITLITEGSTDAEILEHAFTILTNNKIPYWKVKPAGNKSGGAKEVKFILDKAKPLALDNTFVIGLFDHDTEGINQFDGLQFDFYKDYKRVKKMKDANIYGLKLPIPKFRELYVKQEREHFYLAIEHYFDDEILLNYELVKPSGIPGLYKIKDSSGLKTKFSKYIKSLKKAEYFRHFIPLFQTIDDITGVEEIDYQQYI